MEQKYKGMPWEQIYTDEKLRETAKFYSAFFRKREREIRKEREKQNYSPKPILPNSSEY